MPRPPLVLFLTLLVASSALPASAEEKEISLGAGLSKLVKVANVRTVSLTNPKVADVRVVNGELLVSGLSVGRTSLIVWLRNGQRVSYVVAVRGEDFVRALADARDLLADVEGVVIRPVGEHILLEGTVYRLTDARRVEQVVGLHPGIILSQVDD